MMEKIRGRLGAWGLQSLWNLSRSSGPSMTYLIEKMFHALIFITVPSGHFLGHSIFFVCRDIFEMSARIGSTSHSVDDIDTRVNRCNQGFPGSSKRTRVKIRRMRVGYTRTPSLSETLYDRIEEAPQAIDRGEIFTPIDPLEFIFPWAIFAREKLTSFVLV